ncbi:MAG: hypothetical protein ACI4L2_03260, partial [Wujia sp.]
LEPTRYCYHRHLKPARLPIPPLPLAAFRIISFIGVIVNRKIAYHRIPIAQNAINPYKIIPHP